MNDLFLRALNGRNTEGPPIWLMRQAGRHLATYRSIRKHYSFLQMCQDPDLITRVTLLPLEAYQVDAAILFSDILLPAEAMGLGLRFEDVVGPIIERPITTVQDIEAIPLPDMSKLEFVATGIRQLKPLLQVPLIGFCGAPFTFASYLIEGRTSRDLKKTKRWMFQNPEAFHSLLKIISDWMVAYLTLQIQAGVDAIQIFDSWANVLAHHQFCEFSQSYLNVLLKALKPYEVPCILFCRGSSVFAPHLAELQPHGIGVDWNCRLAHMRRLIPCPIALQGNLDPDLLYSPIRKLEAEVEQLLSDMDGDPAFIVNLGHGIPPDVSEESVRSVVECVRRKRKCPITSLS